MSRSSLIRVAWCLGMVAQGIILGLLLALAFVTLSSWSGGLTAFRYEAF